MAAIAAAPQVGMLNWLCGGAAAAQPTSNLQAVNVSLGSPTYTSASEIATGSGFTRQVASFGGAVSGAAGGTATNSIAMTFGPASAGATITGVELWTTNASGAGTYLAWGTLATIRTLGAGDSLVFAVGSCVVTLV